MLESFGNKSYQTLQAQEFEQYIMQAAYDVEESLFVMTVEVVPMNPSPPDVNLIYIQTLQKIKK